MSEAIAVVPFPRNRWQAGVAHLLASAVVGLVVYLLIRFAWYPEVLYYIAGGAELTLLIIGCDVVIGPLLTTIVFKRGKKTLKFDLAVIFVLQIAAMAYGAYIMYVARPVVLVAATDRIFAIGYNQIDPVDWEKAPPTVTVSPWRPTQYSVAMPFDELLRNQLVDQMLSGKDLHLLPSQYRPFDEALESLKVSARKDDAGRLYVPLIARNGDGMAYLDENGNLKQMQEGDPWKTAKPTP